MTSSPAQPEDKPLAEQRKQTEAELEAIRQQLKGLQASDPTDQATGPDQAAMADLEERRRLLNVIMYFKNEKLWRLDELLSLKKNKPPAIGDDPLVKALGTTPPYHVLQVDALRDELDSMKERHHWLQNVLHTGTTVSLVVDVAVPTPARYTIERTVPHPPVVRDSSGTVTTLRPEDVVRSLEIFGQHELAELARDVLLRHRAGRERLHQVARLVQNAVERVVRSIDQQ